MKPTLVGYNVRASCPDCDGTVTMFEYKDASKSFGSLYTEKSHTFNGKEYQRTLYILLRCASCGRGGLAVIHDNGNVKDGELETFFPVTIEIAKVPNSVPKEILAEFREAEVCASVQAWRAASALLRSTLEKILRANGYTKGKLAEKIDEAANDGIITEARRKRAHEDIRVLGNDVLHDDWREVTEDEVNQSHHYIQRILEDFYDDRNTVEIMLRTKGRIT